MPYNYDALYKDEPNALGPPTDIFVRFFEGHADQRYSVLDVGCGQGRDALFIARLGHAVVGVDLSPHGIKDMIAVAESEDLDITGVTADITSYTPDGTFDIILIDRTLHMLDAAKGQSVLAGLLPHVNPLGWVLIADETSNMQGFKSVIAQSRTGWQTTYEKGGYLFIQRTN